MRLEQIYQEVILDHYRHPHHRGLREPFGAQVHHVNPTCGDEVTLRVQLGGTSGGTPVVDAVTWEGQGCSISQASVSVLTDLVTGADQPRNQEAADVSTAADHRDAHGHEPS